MKQYDQPDLELALRGRPAELGPLRVEVIPPGARPRARWLGPAIAAVARRKWLLLNIIAGAILVSAWIHQYTGDAAIHLARVSLEVTPPAVAEVVIRRASDPVLLNDSAQVLSLATLPEYAQARNFWESLTNTPAGMPPNDEFLPALNKRMKFEATPDGRVVDISIRSTDSGRAVSFLNLLAGQIVRDRENRRAEAVRPVRGARAVEVTRARSEMDEAEKAMLAVARADAATGVQSLRFNGLRHEYELKRRIYEAAVQGLRDAEAANSPAADVRVLSQARIVQSDSPLPLWVSLLVGALAGTIIGIPICLVRDATDRVVRVPGDVGVDSLGVIPHAAMKHANRLGPGVPDLTGSSLFAAGPLQPARELRSESLAEAFRHVLASLWIAGQNNRRARVILVASPGGREGKTTVLANLGIALANSRRRVLILDANLRRPQLHTMFGAPPTWGLANLLEDDRAVEDYNFEDLVFETNVPGLYVLPAGSGQLAIASVGHVDRLKELLLRFRLEFHAVLIDTPAALEFPEARILARMSDAVTVVMRAGRSQREKTARLVRQLEDDGATVLGAVLNDYRNVQ